MLNIKYFIIMISNIIKSNAIAIGMVTGAKFIGCGLACIGAIGSGIGIGLVFGCFLISVAANENLKDYLLNYAIFGFALSEAMGLLSIMMGLLILFL